MLFSIITVPIVCDEVFVSVDSIIKNRKTFYNFNGTVDVPIEKKEVDLIAQSGVILNEEREKSIKDKRTIEEIRQSMAKLKGAEEAKIETKKRFVSRKEIDLSKAVLLKKDAPLPIVSQKKSKILQSLYYCNTRTKEHQ